MTTPHSTSSPGTRWSRRQWLRAGLGALVAATGARLHAAEPQMRWLDNGTIRLGIDLSLGGAITWLSRSGSTSENLINSWDWGRQVQMSYYSGPVPFIVGDKRPAKVWEGLGWNPIQAGDHYHHGSRTLEHRNDGTTLYVKCIPMQWPMDDVPAECTFESWLELDGAVVKARCRLVNARADTTQYPARGQELPAVYTNGPWHRLLTYSGDSPFTGGALTTLPAQPPPHWAKWFSTERWSALVDDRDWGLGVWNPDCVQTIGGFAGKPGAGGAKDNPCGYLAPHAFEILDHNITHEYRYHLVLGTLEEIRAHVYRQPRPAPAPAWRFEKDRQGWIYRNARDGGWPVRGELSVEATAEDPSLVSPHFFCRAPDATHLVLDAAFPASVSRLQLFWATREAPTFEEKRTLQFDVKADGEYHEHRVPLPAAAADWSGEIIQLRLDPVAQPQGPMRFRSIRLER